MSLLEKANELRAALSTVDGVTGYDRMPSAPKPGDAWVGMGRSERARGDAFTVAWRVRVHVPAGDERAALEFFDPLWAPLFYALAEAAEVDGFAPVVIGTKAGDLWAYEIICRTGD